MDRITDKYLQALCDRINRAMDAPADPWRKTDNGLKANIGNYHLSGAYGGKSLHRMVTDGGAVSDVFSCGHVPKRELADRMRAFLVGIDAKQAA